MTTSVAGLHVPLVTPFAADGGVDLDALGRLAARVLTDGADGLVALGTTGEAVALTLAEQDAVVDCCAAACAARGALLTVGVGGSDTATAAREIAHHGARDGVHAIMSVVPPYVRPAQAGLIEHFRRLADASPVPLLVYDIVARTGVRFSPGALLELHALEPRVIGAKLTVPALDGDALALLADAPDSFAVLAGEDPLILPLLALGARGAIAAAAHCATGRFAALVRAGLAGEMETARALHAELLPLVRALYAEPNPVVIKGVLARGGEIATAAVRLPNVPATDAAVAAVPA